MSNDLRGFSVDLINHSDKKVCKRVERVKHAWVQNLDLYFLIFILLKSFIENY